MARNSIRGTTGAVSSTSGDDNGDASANSDDSGAVSGALPSDHFIDPATLDGATTGGDGSAGSEPASGERKGKRGRKPGAKTAQKKGVDLGVLNSLLYMAHAFLAETTKTPELALSEQEAEKLGAAASNVVRHYPVNVDEKTKDWIMLAACMGTIYAPRVALIRARKNNPTPSAHASLEPVVISPFAG